MLFRLVGGVSLCLRLILGDRFQSDWLVPTGVFLGSAAPVRRWGSGLFLVVPLEGTRVVPLSNGDRGGRNWALTFGD